MRPLKHHFLLFTMIAFFLSAAAQKLKPGDKAPDIRFLTELDGRYQKGFEKGKYVVLDFWGTWCAPCIATFPKLNQLQQSFAGSNIVFAAITNEKEEKIRRFLQVKKDVQLHLAKLIDDTDEQYPEGKTFTDFGVSTVPFTVIIAPDGAIRWIGAAHNLTEESIRNAISQSPLKETAAVDSKPQVNNMGTAMDTFMVEGFTISTGRASKPSRSVMLNTFPEKGNIRNYFGGSRVDQVLKTYYQLSDKQIEIKGISQDEVPVIKFGIQRKEGASWDSLALLASKVLTTKYGFRYSIEPRTEEVWEISLTDVALLRKNAAPFDSTSGKSNTGASYTHAYANNYFFKQLKELIDYHYEGHFLLKDHNLQLVTTQLFDFSIPLHDMEALKSRLATYGVTMEKVKKKVPYLVLTFQPGSPR